MKKVAVALIIFCAVNSTVCALWSVQDKGSWPESWPEELDPLRERSQTYEGGLANQTFYLIPFTKREELEAAWPHILRARTEGVPLTLLRSPSSITAGVRIWHPAVQSRNIELIVDGNIVDLNRIQLPPDTPIIDQRFDSENKKPAAHSDLERLQGQWVIVECQRDGTPYPGEVGGKILFEGKNAAVSATDGSKTEFQIALVSPDGIDWTIEVEGKRFTLHGLYKFDGDSLITCSPPAFGTPRPRAIGTTAGDGQWVFRLKRLPASSLEPGGGD